MKTQYRPKQYRPKVSCELIRVYCGETFEVNKGEKKKKGSYVVRVQGRENCFLLAHLRKNDDVRLADGYSIRHNVLKRLARKTFARMAADFPCL